MCNNILVRDATYFTRPVDPWQRRYEALRASFVERLPAQMVAERYGFSPGYIRLLRHQFSHGKIDFAEPSPEGRIARRRVGAQARRKIGEWRKTGLSAGEIAQLMSEEGADLSVRTVERVLAEEGFPKLPRRTRLKIGLTVKGAQVPERAESFALSRIEGRRMESVGAGGFLFAPFVAPLGLCEAVQPAGPARLAKPQLRHKGGEEEDPGPDRLHPPPFDPGQGEGFGPFGNLRPLDGESDLEAGPAW